MTIQTYENKGDLYVCIKDAPEGLKKKLEGIFADVTIKEIKGLVKEPEEKPDIPEDGWVNVGPENEGEVPFKNSKEVETKDDFVNDNLPFKNPKKESKESVPAETKKELSDDDLFG